MSCSNTKSEFTSSCGDIKNANTLVVKNDMVYMGDYELGRLKELTTEYMIIERIPDFGPDHPVKPDQEGILMKINFVFPSTEQ
jgi:hypothetical protein